MIDAGQIADAVVAELNATAFREAFIAERKYIPYYDAKDLTTMKMVVVLGSITQERVTRALMQYDFTIQICPQVKVDDAETRCPDLIALVQDLVAYMQGRALSSCTAAQWIKTEVVPYDLTMLAEYKVFSSVVRLTYRVMQ